MKIDLKGLYRKFNKNYQAYYLSLKEFNYFTFCSKILDLGCGDGNFIDLDPKRIFGIDNNKENINICKKKKLKIYFGKVTKLSFPKDSFDGIHCAHVIEHLLPNDAYLMLKEVGRVLKINGIFVISTPILWKGFYNDFSHIKPYNPESILRYLCQDSKEKTYNINTRFERIDFYWRYDVINIPSKLGKLLANYLFQFGFHNITKNAYTLVLKKVK